MKTKAQKIAELKAEIERLEKEPGNVWGWLEPETGHKLFCPCFFAEVMYSTCVFQGDAVDERILERGLIFATPEQAAAVADAMIVMCQLRRCEGAGKKDNYDYGHVYLLLSDGKFAYEILLITGSNTICPEFSSRELCMAAVAKVGIQRVEAAIKLWAMVDA